MVHIFKSSMVLPHKIHDVFQFFSDATNLESITPPKLCFRIITPTPIPMGEGTLIDYKLHLHGISFTWTARIRSWDPPFQFIDEQLADKQAELNRELSQAEILAAKERADAKYLQDLELQSKKANLDYETRSKLLKES